MAQSQPKAKARPILEARRVASLAPPGQDVSYMVIAPATKSREHRIDRRWRTHLRSGKIVDGRTILLSESQVRDRSARGARLRLAASVPLPARIRFFDDVSQHLYEAVVAWRRGAEIGVTFLGEVDLSRLTRPELFRLGLTTGAPCRG